MNRAERLAEAAANLHQVSLAGKDVEPWKDICCEACWNAEYERCVCRCGGQFHGVGNPNSKRNKDLAAHMELTERVLNNGGTKQTNPIEDFEVGEGMAVVVTKPPVIEVEPTLAEYEQITPTDCRWCEDKGKGTLGPIEHYDHSGGWPVKGFEKKQWLYRTCNRCGYQWAIWKLGVSRSYGR